MNKVKEKKLPPIFKKNEKKKEDIDKALDNVTRESDKYEELEGLDYPFGTYTD